MIFDHKPYIVISAILCCSFLVTLSTATHAYRVPDTGVNTCQDLTGSIIPCPESGEQFYGQDAHYGPGGMIFISNTNGTVIDENTLLVWDAADSATTYNWPDALNQVAALNAASYKGHSDWRLPTEIELNALLNYSIPEPGPMIDSSFFPNCHQGTYWTSDSYAADPAKAWGVDFSTAEDVIAAKDSAFFIRVVRGGE